ncbi:hypothetical protein DBP18_32735, partial [Streptomyces sp. CS081A]
MWDARAAVRPHQDLRGGGEDLLGRAVRPRSAGGEGAGEGGGKGARPGAARPVPVVPGPVRPGR